MCVCKYENEIEYKKLYYMYTDHVLEIMVSVQLYRQGVEDAFIT